MGKGSGASGPVKAVGFSAFLSFGSQSRRILRETAVDRLRGPLHVIFIEAIMSLHVCCEV